MTSIIAAIELPFPSADLSPNSRLHWAKKARATKKARNDARIACLAAGIRGLDWEGATVAVTYHEPDNRRRDMDGLISRSKAIFDGIADATGIDDSKWTFAAPARGPVVKHGKVVIRLSPATPHKHEVVS